MAGAVREAGEAAGGDQQRDQLGVGKDHAEDQQDRGEKDVIALEKLVDSSEEREDAFLAELGHGDEREEDAGGEGGEGEEGEDGGVAVGVNFVPEGFE